jgi:hypothetical protein
MGAGASKVDATRRSVPYTYQAGRRHWVEVESEVAAGLVRFDRWMRRRDAIFRKHHVPATDLREREVRKPWKDRRRVVRLVGYLNHELEPAARAAGVGATGYPWAGPRFSFTLLLGESPTWSGPASLWVEDGHGGRRCRFCGHLAVLPAIAYCLNPDCCRSGRDQEIEPGRARRNDKLKPSGLKGGRGEQARARTAQGPGVGTRPVRAGDEDAVERHPPPAGNGRGFPGPPPEPGVRHRASLPGVSRGLGRGRRPLGARPPEVRAGPARPVLLRDPR